MAKSSHPSDRTCPNCGHSLAGEYCPSCGQHAVDIDVPLRKFLAESLHESFALDSKLFRTFKSLLFKPGFLTQEYLAGRRARYVPPLRLYLVLSFTLFILLAWTAEVDMNAGGGSNGEAGNRRSNINITLPSPDSAAASETPANGRDSGDDTAAADTGESESTIGALISEQIARAVADPDRFRDAFLDRLAQVVFLLLPAFALLLKVLYRRRLYVHHLIFSVYFHSFAFAVIIVSNLIELVGFDTLSGILVLVIPVYLLFGMKRAYEQKWPRTILKWGTLGMAHMSALLITLFGALATTLFFF